MSKITLTSIQDLLTPMGWQVISSEYVNLDTEMLFMCDKQHKIFLPWKKLRNKIECPICKDRERYIQVDKIIPKTKGATRILALDQASHITGYAIFDDTQLITSGTFLAQGSEEVLRISSIKNWLLSMMQSWRPDIIGIEGILFQEASGAKTMGVTVFETLAHLQGVIMLCCYENEINFKVCPTNTWRHQCGVKGRTRTDKKRSMQLLVKEWYDITVSDDIADAIGIGYYLSHQLTKFKAVENWEK